MADRLLALFYAFLHYLSPILLLLTREPFVDHADIS